MAIEKLELIGGHPCLDFVNTAGDHLAEQPGEWLHTYPDLLTWSVRANLLTDEERSAALVLAGKQPRQAAEALARAIAARESIYHLLLSIIRGQQPQPGDLAEFNLALKQAPERSRVSFEGGEYHWRPPDQGAEPDLDLVLWQALWSAADLLTSRRSLARVKLCEGDQCGWLFLDSSRNHSRRWCSMSDCGNRAKANRYYQRHKG